MELQRHDDYGKLLAVYLAFEGLRGYENIDNWFAELRDNDNIAVDYGGGFGVRVFKDTAEACDYFRAEAHLIRLFGALPADIQYMDVPSLN